ncbi:protein-lysine N-methyltransferase SMYD4-like [Rhynchophorus ferrugineus]|uniref:protein-lysine N-methyltransferase SMYD4-like n=1 Tax=Rhynchophorus ferrugineus TaxID=354439 RepID=UPI003FCD1E60
MTDDRFVDIYYKELCSERTLQSNSKGFFLTFADYVADQVGEHWIKNKFGKLKNDIERIKCVYESNETQDLVENFLGNVKEIYRPKNGDFSQKRRLEAERFLKQKEYQKALQLYCQSVLRAPKTGSNTKIDSGLSLSLALWGRAQAFIGLQRYFNALCDIQQALKENLPGSYKGQAFWKMGVCYRGLGEDNRAKVSFDLAEKMLHNDEENIKMLNEDRKGIMVREVIKKPNELPKLAKQNDNFPSASEKLSVKTSKDAGRYVIANQDISSGETLVVESPYAACLLPDMFGLFCHNCFNSLETPLGCPECSSVAFCSAACRDEAISTYHKYECKYLDLLIGSGMSILAHTALRMITQNGLEKSLAIRKNRNKEKVYQLCTHSELRPASDFLQRTLMASFLLRCLQKAGFFHDKTEDKVLPSEEQYQIGDMLLFNLQMLQFNAHEVYHAKCDPDKTLKDSQLVYIGVAVYLTTSLFNHDCFPATARYFVGKNIILTAARPLKANDPVPENYGPIFTKKILPDRQRSLSSRYWFKCQCQACIQNWPAFNMGLETATKRLRCPTEKCSKCYTLPLLKESFECSECKKLINLSNKIILLHWCEEQYQVAFQYMDSNQLKEAIDVLTLAIDTFYKIALPPHKATHLAEAMLCICFNHMAVK